MSDAVSRLSGVISVRSSSIRPPAYPSSAHRLRPLKVDILRPACIIAPCRTTLPPFTTTDEIQRLLRGDGRRPQGERRGDQAGVPETRAKVPSGRFQGARRRGKIQGNRRSLRDAQGSGETRRLRQSGQQLSARAGLSPASGLGKAVRRRAVLLRGSRSGGSVLAFFGRTPRRGP